MYTSDSVFWFDTGTVRLLSDACLRNKAGDLVCACTGDADAYGTIADCYTDMGEFEKAAQFYDK